MQDVAIVLHGEASPDAAAVEPDSISTGLVINGLDDPLDDLRVDRHKHLYSCADLVL